jgi:hypothetical protein
VYFEVMSSGDYPKNVPSAGLIGIVAGALMGVVTGNSAAFWLGSVVVGAVALSVLNASEKD